VRLVNPGGRPAGAGPTLDGAPAAPLKKASFLSVNLAILGSFIDSIAICLG
jgi:hypothetical protein